MSKAQYEKVAAILLAARGEFGNCQILGEQAIHCIEHDLADMFANDNERFNRCMFEKASREPGWTPAISRQCKHSTQR